MGAKLQPEIGDRDKLQRRIHLNTHTSVVRLNVGLKKPRRLVELTGLQIMMQIILGWKQQMMEGILMGLMQIMSQIK